MAVYVWATPITNSSIQPWLDFNGTLRTSVPACQQKANDYGLINSPNITAQNCTEICTDLDPLKDPLLPNNRASSVASNGFSMENKDLAPFISLGLDHKNVTYANQVQDKTSSTFNRDLLQAQYRNIQVRQKSSCCLC